MSVLELRAERAQLVEAQRAILAKAEGESRDLLASEARKWDANERRFDELTSLIEKGEQTDERHREMIAKEAETRENGGEGESEYRLGEWLQTEIRGLTGSGVTGGGAFTPADFPRMVWDRLAAESVGLRSGLTIVRTDRDEVKIPRWKADTTAAWVAEAATISSTDADADLVTATPQKLAGLQAISNEAIDDSNPSLLEVVGRNLIRSVALKFDLGVFEGSGTAPEIEGLKNVTGIQTVSMGTDGAALADLDPFADALGLLAEENAVGSAIVMHPRSWKAILKLKEDTTDSNKPLIQDEVGGVGEVPRRSIYGVPVFLTSQLSITETQGTSTDASSAYVYQASEVIAVLRKEVEVALDRSRLFDSDQSELRAIARADVVVPNSKAVCRIEGIIP